MLTNAFILFCKSASQPQPDYRRITNYTGPAWARHQKRTPSGLTRGLFHLSGEFVVTDRPRLPDFRRAVFAKHLFERPHERFLSAS